MNNLAPLPATGAIDGRKHEDKVHGSGGWWTAAAMAGVSLAAAATLNNWLAKRAEQRNPPIGRFLTVDETRLHYIERGTGSPIVLIHGNGAMVGDWVASGVFDSLAAHHRVVAFDRPGFGYTLRSRTRLWTPRAQAALFAQAMHQLGVESAVIVGHSWGVLPALALALDFPATASGLVLMSGVFYPQMRSDIVTSLPSSVPGIGDVMCQTITPLLASVTSPMQTKAIFKPAPVHERFADFPMSMSLRPGQMRAQVKETTMLPVVTGNLARRYGELSLPVTILTGADDAIVSPDSQSERLHKEIDGSRLIKLAGIGHMANYSALSDVVAAIRETAASSDQSAGAYLLRCGADRHAHDGGMVS